MAKWSITQQKVREANDYAGIMCSEINVKSLVLPVGTDEQGREIKVVYKHDTLQDKMEAPLDFYIGDAPQNKQDFAAYMYFVLMRSE